MAGSSVYPGALDNFSNNSPTNLGDNDSTGRTHSERHDDVEASVEAVQSELGLNPSGAFATVRARLDDLDEGFGNTFSTTTITPGVGSKVFTVDVIGSYVVGSYVVVSSTANPLTIFMVGKISNITGLVVTVLVDSAQGIAAADWVFSLTGPQPTIAQIINVNTTTPALRVTQTGTGNALVVEDSTSPDSSPFVVDANGLVGIGTTTPAQPIDIQAVNFGYNATRYHASLGGGMDFRRSKSGTVGVNTAVASGDSLGRVLFTGADGTSYVTAASIEAAVDGTPGTNDMPGRLVFSTTADGASSPTERMRITQAGNVGIGTSSPDSKLTISDATNSTTPLTVDSGGGSDSTRGIAMNVSGGNYGRILVPAGSGGAMAFWAGSLGAATERMRIHANGNVGIGGPSSGTLLDVVGGASDVLSRIRNAAGIVDLTMQSGGNFRITHNTAGKNINMVTGGAERFILDSAGLITGTGTSLGAWTAYTPTLGGFTVGNGVFDARYNILGKRVDFEAAFTFGSTSAAASAFITLTLPVTARATTNVPQIAGFFDVSATAYYTAPARMSSTTTVSLGFPGTNGVFSAPSTTLPFTWATGDIIRVSGTYEAA